VVTRAYLFNFIANDEALTNFKFGHTSDAKFNSDIDLNNYYFKKKKNNFWPQHEKFASRAPKIQRLKFFSTFLKNIFLAENYR